MKHSRERPARGRAAANSVWRPSGGAVNRGRRKWASRSRRVKKQRTGYLTGMRKETNVFLHDKRGTKGLTFLSVSCRILLRQAFASTACALGFTLTQ